ncbi:MAG: ComF family protein [Magnetococcales bacterium]|nr:ComF family protein [Magnetococcales bacterium]
MRCGAPTPRPELGCGACLNNPHALDAAYFAFPYTGQVAELILGFKFADRPERCRLLVDLCWERLERALFWEDPDLIVPMPLHIRRLLRRRYNQSALLAQEVGARLGKPVSTDLLMRHRHTRAQTRLDARARQLNVQGAFRVVDPERLKGRSVLLVDDVMTTGATMHAAVATLKRAGSGRVSGFCLARVDAELKGMSSQMCRMEAWRP